MTSKIIFWIAIVTVIISAASAVLEGDGSAVSRKTASRDVDSKKSNESCNCSFGTCLAPDTCTCDNGWAGKSCDKPILCFVAKPIGNNSIETKSNLTESDSTEIAAEKLPPCSPDCLDQISTIHVNFTRKTPTVTYHYIAIDSPCHVIAPESDFSTRHKTVLDVVWGILMLVMIAKIVYIAYIVTEKIRIRNNSLNHSREFSSTNDDRINLIYG